MVLSHKVRVNTGGIHGNCWFASEDIEEGELIWWTDGVLENDRRFWVPAEEVKNWSDEKLKVRHAYQISEDIYWNIPEDRSAIPEYSDKDIQDMINELYVNHSCDGNCWYDDDDHLVARRRIPTGEEISYDYVFHETNPVFNMKCLCGKELCRGTVTGEDYKNRELQERYGTHFMDHVLRLQGRTRN